MHRPTRRPLFVATSFAFVASLHVAGATNPLDRWAQAVGGLEKIAAVRSIYREASISVMGYEGSVKAWHTFDGKYRKEEQVATFSSIEIFDGTTGTVQQGAAPPRPMSAADLLVARSKAFANSNAMFFAFFPDRRRGSVAIEGDRIVLKPDGGIDWIVTLDPKTSLPKTMVHQEGDQTVTVTFVSYETVGGIQFEKEIERTSPRFSARIRFTKTVINPPVEPSMFSVALAEEPRTP